MSKKVWRVYVQYDGWYPVGWAPLFDTEEDANNWIAEIGRNDGWDSFVEANEEEIEDEEYEAWFDDDELPNDGEHE